MSAMGSGLVERLSRVNAVKVRMASRFRPPAESDGARRLIDEHLDFLHPLAEGRLKAALRALGQHIDTSLALALGQTL